LKARIKTVIATIAVILFGSIVGIVIQFSTTILSNFGLTESFIIAAVAAIPISLFLDWIIGDFKIFHDQTDFFIIYFITFFALLGIIYGIFNLGNPLAELIPW